VLLFDRKWHEEAWSDLAKKIRNKSLTRYELEHHVHGRTTGETLPFILGRRPTKKESKKLLRRKELLYQKIALSKGKKFQLSPGAISLFDLLKKNKIKFTIATSSPLINLKFYYKYLNLGAWFPFRKVVYDNQSFPGKPAPDIYLKAAKKLRKKMKEVIVIEDAKSGVESARKAKAGKIIFISNTHSKKLVKVDKIITSLKEISNKDFKK
jgi:HAD superfamily hydrolase (TIGR01509 family)